MWGMSFADRIIEGARELRPARLLANVIGAIPYAIGWVVATIGRGAWAVISWVLVAARLGFTDTWARRKRRTT